MSILHPQRRNDLRCKLLPDGHLAVFDESSGWAHLLNPFAAAVWELCDGKFSTEEIIDELERHVPNGITGELKSDVRSLIEQFREDGLLQSPIPKLN